jgi:hypothetical protein
MLGDVSETQIRSLIRKGQLELVKLGRMSRITDKSLRRLMNDEE